MQLSSKIYSYACDWNHKVEGDPFVSPVNGIDLGLTINPGTQILSSAFNILTPLVTSGNPAVDTFGIFFIIPLGSFVIQDTINNLNALFLNTWYFSDQANYAVRGIVQQNPVVPGTPGNYQIKAISTAPITAGRVMVNFNCVQMFVD